MSITAGWNTISAAPSRAHFGVARRCHAITPAIARSARLAGVFITARIAGSAEVVTVRKAGSSAARSAPEVGHDRREGHVLVVGVAERRGRDAVDPQDELVEVADEAGGRPERDPDEKGEDEPDGEGAGDPDPPSGRGRDVGSLELDQHGLTRSCTRRSSQPVPAPETVPWYRRARAPLRGPRRPVPLRRATPAAEQGGLAGLGANLSRHLLR